VTIAPKGSLAIDVLSGLAVKQGTKVLFARNGSPAAWFKAQGYPLPVAASKSGALAWDVAANGQLKFALVGLDLPTSSHRVCDVDGCHDETQASRIDSAK